jgi:hypothetical protein
MSNSKLLSKSAARVFIAWTSGEEVCTLGWGGGSGGARVYNKDSYDSRLDIDRERDGPLPYFDNAATARAWLQDNPDGYCQVDTKLAADFGVHV